MPPAGLEPEIPATGCPQINALNRAATGISLYMLYDLKTHQEGKIIKRLLSYYKEV
jgi:hypothetical protein